MALCSMHPPHAFQHSPPSARCSSRTWFGVSSPDRGPLTIGKPCAAHRKAAGFKRGAYKRIETEPGLDKAAGDPAGVRAALQPLLDVRMPFSPLAQCRCHIPVRQIMFAPRLWLPAPRTLPTLFAASRFSTHATLVYPESLFANRLPSDPTYHTRSPRCPVGS